MQLVPVDLVIEISRFINQDERLVFLGRVNKSWRNRTKSLRAKILRLNNGPDADPIICDGSVISIIKFHIRSSNFDHHLYHDLRHLLGGYDRTELKRFRESVHFRVYGLKIREIIGESRAVRMLTGRGTGMSFCNAQGGQYDKSVEHIYFRNTIHRDEYDSKIDYPAIEVTHSPLSIVEDKAWDFLPEPKVSEIYIERWEHGDHRFKVLHESIRMWEVFCDDMIRFGLDSKKDVISGFMKFLRNEPHPFTRPESMLDSDNRPISFERLNIDQERRLKAVLEPHRSLAHVRVILENVEKMAYDKTS